MLKFLIFRTDRIGDFIFSRILTESIKKQNSNNIVDFVCSSYNSKYVKNFKDVRRIFILDKYDMRLMLKNLFQINNSDYDYIIILDGKRRSVFFSIFLKAKNKIAVLKDFRPKIILRLFFNYFFINSEVNSQFDNFSSIINFLNFKVPKNINYYNKYIFKKNRYPKFISNYTLIHLDEKWFRGYYYKDFQYMDLNDKNFDFFIKSIKKKFKKKIVISCGRINVNQFEQIISKKFNLHKNDIYFSKKFKNKLIFIDKTDFRDLEILVKNCSELVCCEGAISHVSNAFKINTYALVNNLKTARFWTKHMENIKILKRENIKNLSEKILKFNK